MSDLTDNELIQRASTEDTYAYELLVKRYETRLVHSLQHALGSREEALDAAQDAFVSAWRAIGSYRQQASFYSWLYRIAMNAAISNKRRRKLKTTSLDKVTSAAGADPSEQRIDSDPAHRSETEETVAQVQTALAAIAEEFRQPLILKEIDGLSYEEIAAALSIPIGTVRSRIFRARKELTERLQRRLK